MSIVQSSRSSNNALVQSQPATNTNDVHQLIGHEDAVLGVDFDPTGDILASCGADKKIMLWDSDLTNYGTLIGHKGAVTSIRWDHDSTTLFTSSTDLTLGSWDVVKGERLVKHVGHQDMVNDLKTTKRGATRLVSGSDDGSVAVWDPSSKQAVMYWETEYPILSVECDDLAQVVWSTGIESSISAWDVRNVSKPIYTLPGHNQETITSVALSPDKEQLASFGQDNAVKTWNVKPFVKDDSRHLQTFDGANHGIEQNLHRCRFSPSGKYLAAASFDHTVAVWDVASRTVQKLSGHRGSVNDVAWSATDNKIATGSTDRSIIVGYL